MAVREGEEYRFSVWSRVPDGGEAKLKVVIVDTKSARGVAGDCESPCNGRLEGVEEVYCCSEA